MQNDNKVILINGVDVAGCEFYLQDERYSCDLSFINEEELCKCDDVQDCTYKRLEQEKKALKKANEISIEKVTVTAEAKRLQELEQENKELKKQIESQKGLITVGGKQQYEMTMAYDRYKSALEEIRENLKKIFNVCDDDCGNASEIAKVVGLINEVLGC